MTQHIEQQIREILESYARKCPNSKEEDEGYTNDTIKELISLLSQHYIARSELPNEEEIEKIIQKYTNDGLDHYYSAQAIYKRIRGDK